MRISISRMKMLQVSKCLIGLAVMVLQPCETADNRRDLLCGNRESMKGKPGALIYRGSKAYRVAVSGRSGIRRRLRPETYLLQEENGNLFMNTNSRVDMSYNKATDILTFSSNGDYVRVSPKPRRRTFEDWNPDGYPRLDEMREAYGETARP